MNMVASYLTRSLICNKMKASLCETTVGCCSSEAHTETSVMKSERATCLKGVVTLHLMLTVLPAIVFLSD